MNKSELVAAVAAKAEITKKDAAAAVDAVFDVIGDELQKKEKVQLIGFGTFQTSERKARTGRNPQTGAAVKIAASTLPSFKAGKALKEKVNTKPAKKAAKKK
ncbi:MAG: HU family DNA-binding protein [Lachnospiraceae bacterium]|nr:HU family DNA-binding protein [Lachnospiraceae bacterium]